MSEPALAAKPLNMERLRYYTRQCPPLIFATVSGSHLFGFPSVDSDIDLRGFHYLTAKESCGLFAIFETYERTVGDIDIVTQEARKAFRLLCRNGNMLEQIHSPLVVFTTSTHEELKALSLRCITRHHINHYFGSADAQRHMFEQRKVYEIKPILYTYRIIMAGIHLVNTRTVVSNINLLANAWATPQEQQRINELIAEKLAGEHAVTHESRMEQIRRDIDSLRNGLKAAEAQRPLSEEPEGINDLNDMLLRLRGLRI